MKRSRASALIVAAAAMLAAGGCRKPPSPPPTPAQQQRAYEQQVEKIKNDPNKTPQQKEAELRLLQMLAITSKSRTTEQKPR